MKDMKSEERFRFDPSKFPKQVDLDLPEEVAIMLERLAARTGRSFSEVATDILSRQIGTQSPRNIGRNSCK